MNSVFRIYLHEIKDIIIIIPKKGNHKHITWHLLPYKFAKQGVGCYSNSTIESQDDMERCKKRS